jgi:hypothetical protein
MYLATLANSANNLYIRNRKQFANDLHNLMLLVSTVHAFALDTIDMLEFMAQVWDEATDHITLAPYLPTFDNTVKQCSAEVMEDMEQPASVEATEFAQILAYVSLAFTQVFTAVTEKVSQTLDELKLRARRLGIKGWNFYTNTEKLTAKINQALAQ